MIWLWMVLPVVAYVFGSISFAWLAGRLKGVDLRQHGSGNLGATNAGRVLGLRWFGIVFCCDVAKGLVPVLLAGLLPQWLAIEHSGAAVQGLQITVAISAILGHVFTFFHGFKGGKAVATSLGVLIALVPLVAACLAGLWLLVWFLVSRLPQMSKSNAVGPASVCAALAVIPTRMLLTTASWGADELPVSIFLSLLALLIVWRHRSNIRQFFSRSEATAAEGS